MLVMVPARAARQPDQAGEIPGGLYVNRELVDGFVAHTRPDRRGPGRHMALLLDAALACEVSGLGTVHVLDRAMDAATLAEMDILAQADDLLQEAEAPSLPAQDAQTAELPSSVTHWRKTCAARALKRSPSGRRVPAHRDRDGPDK